MLDLKACTVCFRTDVKLNDLNSNGLRNEYNLVSGLKTVKGNGLPKYLCVECCAYVKSSYRFRLKCHRAYYALQEILNINKEIKLINLKLFDTASIDIAPNLSFVESFNTQTEATFLQWQQTNPAGQSPTDEIPVIHQNEINDSSLGVPKKKQKTADLLLEQDYPVEVKNEVENTISDEFASQFEKFLTDPTTAPNEDDDDDYFDKDDNVSDDDQTEPFSDDVKPDEINAVIDGSKLEEEYAKMVPLSILEAKAVVQIQKTFSKGKYQCQVCLKCYHSQKRLTAHSRMHDKHFSGNYECELCIYFYKTDFLLKTHMTEKHMYKYLCKECPQVSYDRTSAKQHFVTSHLQKEERSKNNTWFETRPKWLATKGGQKTRGIVSVKPKRKVVKLPEDFLIYSPVSQEEQYALIKERQNTRNYKESHFKCESCYRGFREFGTYSNHMKKHDSEVSGNYMCDMCKLFFPSTRKMYKHMNITHLFRYNCQRCPFVCYNRGQAQMHYKWHNNFTYSCPHCNMEFKKISTRLTHIRIKHPSTFICNLCGHSYVSEIGLVSHRKLSHSKEELLALNAPIDTSSVLYCADCELMFANESAFATHLTSSNKHAHLNQSSTPTRKGSTSSDTMVRRPRGRPARVSSNIVNNGMATSTNCEICNETLSNDVQARKHYQTVHPGTEFLKRYMCDVCGHATKQYANLLVHMRTHTNEKPYECPHCDRRFSMPSNRDRHIVVHTGEKRYQCQHCNRRFTQSSAVKLHIQTVHLKIPYAPWDKKNRKRRKELEGTSGPVSTITNAPPMPIQPQPHKLLMDAQGDYLNAYITYNE